jgi:F-box/leucine-rich repeat protein 2/20
MLRQEFFILLHAEKCVFYAHYRNNDRISEVQRNLYLQWVEKREININELWTPYLYEKTEILDRTSLFDFEEYEVFENLDCFEKLIKKTGYHIKKIVLNIRDIIIDEVRDRIMSIISGNCTELEYFDASGCDSGSLQGVDVGINNNHIFSLVTNCRKLHTLILTNCLITDETMKTISQVLPALINLCITCCKKITDFGIKYISSGCPKLRELYMRALSVTEDAIISIANGCLDLKILSLAQCYNITDTSLLILIEKCINLIVIDLTCCIKITDVGVKEIAYSLPMIQKLCISGCKKISNNAIVCVGKNCHDLILLSALNCPKLTTEILINFSDQCEVFI